MRKNSDLGQRDSTKRSCDRPHAPASFSTRAIATRNPCVILRSLMRKA
nr:hypothetical protein [Nostoc sp. EfeVER01]MDZ7947493.1 hypothetical protein [Nostoc sp. EfeVER01]